MEHKLFSRAETPASIPDGWENKVSRRRILVVEDDDDIRRFNAEALTRSGYHVEAAVDGAAGWEALNAGRYDLLITDNNMPNLSGIKLIKKLNDARIAVRVIWRREPRTLKNRNCDWRRLCQSHSRSMSCWKR